MAFGVSLSVCLLFNAMVALTEEATVPVTPPVTVQQRNETVNATEADHTEEAVALKLSPFCLEDHKSYCINGVCAFHLELEKAICRCFTGYTGERCEHLTLTSYTVDSYEKYIAVGIGVGLLLSSFLAMLYCYTRKRCLKLKSSKLKSPPSVCSRRRPL
ncbi:epigen [Tenrec ecaudatus]|uniref:epigen n=1 Tax=Tenrec ecaudatus TaxID=94439 RepID=UPI003F5A68E3